MELNMNIRTDFTDNILTIYLNGDIDDHNAKAIREEIDMQAQTQKPAVLVLNFKDVSFMDSSGIGLVMGRYKLMQSLNGQVKVCNLTPHISKVMRLAGLDRLAEIENIKSYRKGGQAGE
jgi:stage II sporulation protein AA (anti-sigma F factor antagonist)